ncbi:MAG: RNA polymerase sigma factor [Eubacterium sp.]
MKVLLVQKAKKHDKEAFSILMHQHKQSMYKVARAILNNDEDVADAMQETILTCWEKIHTLKKDEYFKTWLIRILINHCNGIYRQNSKCIPNDSLPEVVVADGEYSNVEWAELLKCLSEKCRTVIVLYYVEGFKVKEIAQLLHISESAVKERLSAGRKKIECSL